VNASRAAGDEWLLSSSCALGGIAAQQPHGDRWAIGTRLRPSPCNGSSTPAMRRYRVNATDENVRQSAISHYIPGPFLVKGFMPKIAVPARPWRLAMASHHDVALAADRPDRPHRV
jgi:hypothetical protein